MKLITNFAVLCLSCIATTALADAPALSKPVKITAAEARGPVFKSPDAVQEKGADGPATDVPVLKSRDGKFTAGLYSAGPSDVPIESYSEDEFMFFLEGGVTLTSADGTVLRVKAGEGAFIPKGWKGRWTTRGYKKYYVVYDAHD
ncbi:MAG: DUF861 domain-containing protein [Proteobacteria bacterium]|nr:DUF861 domain-containing protein [Pseudomonadota bacterium]